MCYAYVPTVHACPAVPARNLLWIRYQYKLQPRYDNSDARQWIVANRQYQLFYYYWFEFVIQK